MTNPLQPSPKEIAAHLIQARERVHSAELLAKAGQLRDAMSRAYYAFFDATTAALLSRGYIAKTHQGLVTLFNREFIVSGIFERGMLRHLAQAKEAREEADYETYKTYTPEQVAHAISAAEEFIAKEV
ncbi:hypothetical protein A3B21_05075 [Candidatus Uhrbacteria bacterium RIFCSPLOWO2_01_FULL_47_24]|uniref:HEPN domain-containing protein n=1 Tax=Candidatus Uhrbacteria bacterium RIFCSPLOWO2_01_FULL_47_24 TaxID=1802401 RepID=A0A1F7UUX1_9BACT|nr:MAG: hypothetical protein A2753_03110 [Candidatus Uhrbacteria bacterium RIFCSPHIGHO2_01_FULL_47_11]OGL69324.1 MAG: hypothetical protein A3D58_03465 [Candidatus Uhrbacteria bacterium RIFCSPHIGHO2_02_FULL_46_47]OGL76394.1 MAG: hypothetical protein A3F52_00755 [Candidatus Uhrbacteria bacterium RIFCSPHIGHO2_12_FULL_47_11]OGL82059.1 MAG: hypothetical protein A3B21_05075 [Candidatus Uhrbacteria bacterium RIFCSPLOWO2_01_FULL_47_24]OGL85453.1 MAG: hypothetical protein A3J03_05240 [Candidatus Uhrbact